MVRVSFWAKRRTGRKTKSRKQRERVNLVWFRHRGLLVGYIFYSIVVGGSQWKKC
jgi:hypothetical protein